MQRAVSEADALAAESGCSPDMRSNCACILALSGSAEKAVAVLNKLRGNGYFDEADALKSLRTAPDFDSLRKRDDFTKILDSLPSDAKREKKRPRGEEYLLHRIAAKRRALSRSRQPEAPMNRRHFLAAGATGAGLAAAMTARTQQKTPPRKARLKAGHQHHSTDADLRVLAALGVNHICSALPSRAFDDNWSVEGLSRLRERVEKIGITLDMVPLPLSSSFISRVENPHIMMGKSPERDREIDNLCQMIRNAAKAGIPAVKYNLSILGVVRTESTRGRGGASYSTFVYSKAKQGPPPKETGRIDEETAWERIAYFLRRIVPAAEESKVRLCCHPHDPGMPRGKGFRGVERVLGSVEGLKKFVGLSASKYHGLNFCQGTVAEMLEKPGEQIYDVIRWFGTRGKIFNVHFRNIKGGFLNFQETFPDDGDVDMPRALRVYKEVGYDGMIMPDHVPRIEGDTNGAQAFAFAFGYIQALIEVINAEP